MEYSLLETEKTGQEVQSQRPGLSSHLKLAEISEQAI